MKCVVQKTWGGIVFLKSKNTNINFKGKWDRKEWWRGNGNNVLEQQ